MYAKEKNIDFKVEQTEQTLCTRTTLNNLHRTFHKNTFTGRTVQMLNLVTVKSPSVIATTFSKNVRFKDVSRKNGVSAMT